VKKIEIHVDALIAIIIVVALTLGFILFQRYQYSIVLQENIDLTWDNEKLKVSLVFQTSLSEICENEKNSEEAIQAGRALPGSTE